MFAAFKERFWLPPRAHGDVVEDRAVGFIELFYDLVYVVASPGPLITCPST